MISVIAWRNIWRHRIRSLVIICAAALGLWGGIFILGLSKGISLQRKEDVIKSQLSHIQIHNPKYLEEKEIKYFIEEGGQLISYMQNHELVEAATGRVIVNGMAASATGATGVMIYGIIPEYEKYVTNMYSKIAEGNYFEDKVRNPIVIGKELAKKRNLKLKSKIILTFQDTSGNLISAAFKVAGIYKTISPKFDESVVFTLASDLGKLTSTENYYQEIAIILGPHANLDFTANTFKSNYPGLKIRTWKDISPELKYIDEMLDLNLYIIIGIILLALTFGLINTMLMAVLERVHELGMLMAIGMNKLKLFFMILFETSYLAFTGGLLGMILAYSTNAYFQKNGIDLSFVQQGFEEFGMSPVIYPVLEFSYYPILAIMIFVFAVISAIYPAIKALQLKPSEAIRKI